MIIDAKEDIYVKTDALYCLKNQRLEKVLDNVISICRYGNNLYYSDEKANIFNVT